jgi:hypothetical protein
MKRTVIILSLIFALAIALSASIPTLAATGTTQVTGSISAVVEITVPTGAVALGDLSPNDLLSPKTDTKIVTVKSNKNWTLTAADTTSPTSYKGYLTTSGGTVHLTNVLSVSAPGHSGDLTGTSLSLNSGAKTSGTPTTVTFSQTPSWDDETEGAYTMTVTFTASN